jgi:hypothetical protein
MINSRSMHSCFRGHPMYAYLRRVLFYDAPRFHIHPNGLVWYIVTKSLERPQLHASFCIGPLRRSCYRQYNDSLTVLVLGCSEG